MNAERTSHPSAAQVETLIDFLERKPSLAKGFAKNQSAKQAANKEWDRITLKLNSMGGGTEKTAKKWIKEPSQENSPSILAPVAQSSSTCTNMPDIDECLFAVTGTSALVDPVINTAEMDFSLGHRAQSELMNNLRGPETEIVTTTSPTRPNESFTVNITNQHLTPAIRNQQQQSEPARNTTEQHLLPTTRLSSSRLTNPVQVRYQEHVVPAKDKPRITFQSAMKVTLTVGQCFGLNPVQGIHANDPAKLRFRFISFRCLYTYISMVGQFTLAFVLSLSLFRDSTSTVGTATALIFYSLGITTTTLFWRLAMKWPKLCMLIAKMESVDPNTDMKLGRKFNISCAVVLSLALLEHGFSELHGLSQALDCQPDSPLYETFMRNSFGWFYIYFPYNDFVGFLSHFFNLQCTFNWNFTDVFVICMSMYLTSRFNQVNQRIIAAKDKNSPSSFWRTMREDYNRSVHLVRQVDKIIGGLVFISFASNLFFICSQLLHTLAGGIKATPRCSPDSTPDKRFFGGYEYSIYFVFSFAFLVFRSLAVSLTAAKVHAASLEPAHALYDVSSSNYCVEVERFLDQIHGDTVALTGLQFFHVKRGLVLTIASTIVTYELVLMQFTGVTPTSPEPE